MLTKGTVFLCVALLGLTGCVLAGEKSVDCDIRAGMERRATIPKSCTEGVISFDYPWLQHNKPLLINAKGRKDDFKLCLYSCTDDVRLRGKKRVLRKGETLCVDSKQRAMIMQVDERQSYAIIFRYLDKANLSAFKKTPNKTC
ncbi:uncharacterized protein LOC110456319 [Mizuhopecten yessoensis]|uniref:Uncharacterized protein n=1 Tax=Mizuhopecten yessoensis TaxID=6573 RepID=A0A210QB95_MIZYE|nr:uncharacterized protein LOC110456319 [Mizuhopecten yessoensis]OWF45995.1 hypothetical protein KP79_PYT15431 [Mizuhopecten yessoensis]